MKICFAKLRQQVNGAYARANNATTGLRKIFDDISEIEKKEIETKQFTDYEDRFQIYLAIAILILNR